MIDVNVHLGHFPFRRLPDDDPAALAERLRGAGVVQAWAGSFEALLHRDVAGVNARLAAACARSGEGLFLPFGTVNPALPDWEEDLRRCAEEHGMRGVRLYPSYHGYDFASPSVAALFDRAGERRLIVQVVWRIEDERTEHPLVTATPVDAGPLRKLVAARPGLSLMLLNSQRDLRGDVVSQLAEAGRVTFDIAMLEGVGGIERLAQQIPYERIVFGSYAPVFVHEAAVLKLRESELGQTVLEAVTQGNAVRVRDAQGN